MVRARRLHRRGRGFETPSAQIMSYKVYILYTNIYDKYYIGQTNCLSRRLTEHFCKDTIFTGKYDGWNLVYVEEYKSRKESMTREKFLKSQRNKEFYYKLIQEIG